MPSQAKLGAYSLFTRKTYQFFRLDSNGFIFLETMLYSVLTGIALIILFGLLTEVQSIYAENYIETSVRQDMFAAMQMMRKELQTADRIMIVQPMGQKMNRDIIMGFSEDAGERLVKYHLSAYSGEPAVLHRDVNWPGDNYDFTGHNPVIDGIIRMWIERDKDNQNLLKVTITVQRGDYCTSENISVYCRNASD